MSPTETPMAASVARFVARLVIRLPSTISRSARKAPTATRYHPIRRFRRRAGSKGSVVAIASPLSQLLEAHLADSWDGIGAMMVWMGGMAMISGELRRKRLARLKRQPPMRVPRRSRRAPTIGPGSAPRLLGRYVRGEQDEPRDDRRDDCQTDE